MGKDVKLTPEEQIAGLQDELKKAVKDLEIVTKAEQEAVKSNSDSLQKIDDLASKVQSQDAEIAELKKTGNETLKELEAANSTLAEAKALNEELLNKVNQMDSEAAKDKLPVIKIDGSEYENRLPNGFSFPGKGIVTHTDLIKDKALQKELVEIKSGVLRKIN